MWVAVKFRRDVLNAWARLAATYWLLLRRKVAVQRAGERGQCPGPTRAQDTRGVWAGDQGLAAHQSAACVNLEDDVEHAPHDLLRLPDDELVGDVRMLLQLLQSRKEGIAQ